MSELQQRQPALKMLKVPIENAVVGVNLQNEAVELPLDGVAQRLVQHRAIIDHVMPSMRSRCDSNVLGVGVGSGATAMSSSANGTKSPNSPLASFASVSMPHRSRGVCWHSAHLRALR